MEMKKKLKVQHAVSVEFRIEEMLVNPKKGGWSELQIGYSWFGLLFAVPFHTTHDVYIQLKSMYLQKCGFGGQQRSNPQAQKDGMVL
jgi:hypothetical protein